MEELLESMSTLKLTDDTQKGPASRQDNLVSAMAANDQIEQLMDSVSHFRDTLERVQGDVDILKAHRSMSSSLAKPKLGNLDDQTLRNVQIGIGELTDEFEKKSESDEERFLILARDVASVRVKLTNLDDKQRFDAKRYDSTVEEFRDQLMQQMSIVGTLYKDVGDLSQKIAEVTSTVDDIKKQSVCRTATILEMEPDDNANGVLRRSKFSCLTSSIRFCFEAVFESRGRHSILLLVFAILLLLGGSAFIGIKTDSPYELQPHDSSGSSGSSPPSSPGGSDSGNGTDDSDRSPRIALRLEGFGCNKYSGGWLCGSKPRPYFCVFVDGEAPVPKKAMCSRRANVNGCVDPETELAYFCTRQ